MPQVNPDSIKYWQWPNVLGIDAALIAVIWQIALAHALTMPVGLTAHFVLGLSVWLTYLADRLFDVSTREEAALLSVRHRFSKRHAAFLWRVWFVVLAVNLLLATQLTLLQLKHGALLLAVCALYTLLNQKLSRKFFPKEICVALIYAGGVMVFLPEALHLGFFESFAFLCLLNCLVIGAKEKAVDSEMRVHSISRMMAERWLIPLACVGAALTLGSGVELSYGLTLSFGLLGLLHYLRTRIRVETFRVLVDTALLLGGVICLLANGM